VSNKEFQSATLLYDHWPRNQQEPDFYYFTSGGRN